MSTNLSFEGSHYLGYYLSSPTNEKSQQFEEAIQSGLQAWLSSRKQVKTLKLATAYKVSSLDPRIGGDLETSVFIKLLFDGLMRRDADGSTVCAVAEHYTVSEDKLRYTFKLRNSFWSDGSPLISYDFEYAWKKILSPNFSSPFASFFRPILNARKAKMGEVSLDDVGVKAIDDQTLVVDLEYQAPYFIELTAHTLYSPINHRIDEMHPNWSSQSSAEFICNGPFKLKSSRPIYNFEFERNPYYWKNKSVYFDEILVNQANERNSIEMFQHEEVDYLGSPFQSFEGFESLPLLDQTHVLASEKIVWICLNTKQFPFSNANFRRALASVINRNELLKHYRIKNSPAFTALPSQVSQHMNASFLLHEDEEKAKEYLELALEELKIKKEDLPVITVCFGHRSEQREAIAKSIGIQWEKCLGIKCRIENYPWHEYFHRITSGRYQVGLMKWFSWFNDPIYTLDVFKYRDEGVNFSKWENSEFQKLLRLSEKNKDWDTRLSYLAKAEEILIKESPVIPICYEKNYCLKNSDLYIPPESFSVMGNYDFSQASFSGK